VSDKEDGKLGEGISEDEVAVTIDYLPEGYDQIEIAQGHLMADASVAAAAGKKIMEGSDCAACHKVDSKSIGPDFKSIAAKYMDDAGSVDYLSNKIINGGSGVWGDVAMAAHPTLSKDDAANIVKYIFSFGQEVTPVKSLPVNGSYTVQIEEGTPKNGIVVIRAAYTDKGANGVPPATAVESFVMKSANLIPAEGDEMDQVNVFSMPGRKLAIVQASGAYTMFKDVDLTGISGVVCVAMVPVNMLGAKGGIIEVRLGSADGELVGSSEMLTPVEGPIMEVPPKTAMIPIQGVEGKQDVYFVYKNEDAASGESLLIHLAASFIPAAADITAMN